MQFITPVFSKLEISLVTNVDVALPKNRFVRGFGSFASASGRCLSGSYFVYADAFGKWRKRRAEGLASITFRVNTSNNILGETVVKTALRALVVCGCSVLVASCGGGSNSDSGVVQQLNPDDARLYVACGNTPNYAQELGSFRMIRWKQFPVTVAIDLTSAPNVNVGDNRQAYIKEIQAGALKWTAAGNGIGAVNFIDSADADIVIRFTNGLSNGVLGQTLWNGPRPYILKGTSINLSVQAFSIYVGLGSAFFLETLRQVVAHEMGHALFTTAHSTQASDMMAFGHTQETLSQRDINTIRESYCSSGIRPATPGTATQ